MQRSRPRRTGRTIVGRRAAELHRRVGEEIRRLQHDGGLTQQALADAAGIDRGYLSQVQRGLRESSLTVLQALALALGADLSVRLYPNAGPAIHDRTQAPILEAMLSALDSRWRRVPEVGVHRPARGVIDLVLHDPVPNLLVASEIESRIDRLEQEIRWANEKAASLPSTDLWRFAAEDSTPRTSRLLVLRATRANRELALRYANILEAAYPAPSRAAWASLTGSAEWPGAALLWADVKDGVATIRNSPPRGVAVGR